MLKETVVCLLRSFPFFSFPFEKESLLLLLWSTVGWLVGCCCLLLHRVEEEVVEEVEARELSTGAHAFAVAAVKTNKKKVNT